MTPRPISNVVHIAGAPVDGEQRCTRCGYLLTPAGLTPFEAGALVRRIRYEHGTGMAVEKSVSVDEMCASLR